MTKLCIISDTHGYHDHVRVPPSDILIHAGDFTKGDQGRKDFREFLVWLERQPAPVKLLISGNHDSQCQKWPDLARGMIKEYSPSTFYLEDSGCEINGIKFYGSPYTPTFFDWYFMADRGADIKRHWDMIPDDTDVLITHGPPLGIGDFSTFGNEHVGCEDLLNAICRISPKLHVYGHVHGGYGHKIEYGGINFINASICNEAYKPVNLPVEIEL